MKLFVALGCCILSGSALCAQTRGRIAAPPFSATPQHRVLTPPVLAKSGALGGNFISTGSSRPLGGIGVPALPNLNPPRRRRSLSGDSRYVGPIYYVPNAFDAAYDPGIAYPPPIPPQFSSGGPAQPIIINQYFGSRAGRTEIDGDGAATIEQPAVAPGDPLTAPETYYLIAYKNHTVYSAMAYWLEGDTLHYVTLQNTHNQASLSLIDVEQTTKLNRDRSVPFSLSGN